MRIIEINIIQFGKFKDAVFTLEDGLNIIRGDNESGKSTLLGFIKFALYGVGRKNPNVAVGERERALSWNIGIAAGSLTVEDTDGKRYRIERSGREGARGSYTDKARIIDLESGAEMFASEVPGEHFLGINAQGYDSMCNIKQLEATQVGGDAVKSVIDNLLSSGDESTDIALAIKTLDTERRRLLHTNGKGGLVYESQMALERLKSEHRGAIVFENECIKNLDELERVELALAKAREEHAMAQKICDAYDDVVRLEKFDKIKEVKSELSILEQGARELDKSIDFDVSLISYERIAELKSAHDTLSRSKVTMQEAFDEYSKASVMLSSVNTQNVEGFADLISEFGAPRAAINYLHTKKAKKSSAAFISTAFSIAGIVLLALAAVLALLQNNMAGAITVAFIAAVLLSVAAINYKKYKLASKEITSFMLKLGEGYLVKDEKKISRDLEEYYKSIDARGRYKNACESARFHLSLATDTFNSNKEAARKQLALFGIFPTDDECAPLLELCEKMRSYLVKKAELDGEIVEKSALLRSLSVELERFNENDIRARMTPEIIQKIQALPFAHLKADRDSALHKTNQFSQYKAGIERNLASITQRRASAEIFPEIEAENERLESLKLRLDAVKLAMETVNAASVELKSDLTPKIRERAQANLCAATAGKYNELFIDENMGLSVFTEGATRPIDSLSKGSLDAAYFSVRLALLQTLLSEKNPPIYMDELLSQLDDNRARNVLSAIAEHSKSAQCVLFTCQHRDVELAKEITDFNLIELN